MRAFDGCGVATALTTTVLKHCGCMAPPDLVLQVLTMLRWPVVVTVAVTVPPCCGDHAHLVVVTVPPCCGGRCGDRASVVVTVPFCGDRTILLCGDHAILLS
jgi:hypothetical protein